MRRNCGQESKVMKKKDHSHTDELSKSDALFEEIFDIALTEDQRKKKNRATISETVAEPWESEQTPPLPKKRIIEAPPLRRGPAFEAKQKDKTKQAPPKKTRSRRPIWILIGILLLAGAGIAGIFLFRAVKAPDLVPSQQIPSPVKLEMPPKPSPPRTEQASLPAPAPEKEMAEAPPAPARVGQAESKETDKAAVETESMEPAPRTEEKRPAASSYPYSIFLGSFRREDTLQRALENYRDNGLSPYPVRVDLGAKGVWFRVFAGHFETRQEAQAFIREHPVSEGEARNTRFAVLIGTYASRQAAEAEMKALRSKGCHPYMVEAGSSRFRIYTGAFYRDEDAETELSWLAAKGVQGRIVER